MSKSNTNYQEEQIKKNETLDEIYFTEYIKKVAFLEDMKREIEEDGLIPTIDEALNRIRISLSDIPHDCKLESKGFCDCVTNID